MTRDCLSLLRVGPVESGSLTCDSSRVCSFPGSQVLDDRLPWDGRTFLIWLNSPQLLALPTKEVALPVTTVECEARENSGCPGAGLPVSSLQSHLVISFSDDISVSASLRHRALLWCCVLHGTLRWCGVSPFCFSTPFSRPCMDFQSSSSLS